MPTEDYAVYNGSCRMMKIKSISKDVMMSVEMLF